MSRSNLYFFAAVMFLIAALASGLSGQTAGFTVIALAVVMLVMGIRERRGHVS